MNIYEEMLQDYKEQLQIIKKIAKRKKEEMRNVVDYEKYNEIRILNLMATDVRQTIKELKKVVNRIDKKKNN